VFSGQGVLGSHGRQSHNGGTDASTASTAGEARVSALELSVATLTTVEKAWVDRVTLARSTAVN